MRETDPRYSPPIMTHKLCQEANLKRRERMLHHTFPMLAYLVCFNAWGHPIYGPTQTMLVGSLY